jgi:DNA-binding CsgD family transcriptional regulator
MATLASTPRLRGRKVELRTLVDALGRAAGGRPAIVVVEGEAGIGKTRLLAEALDAARARGLEVVAGRGQDLERTRPFGLLADGFGCSRSSPDQQRAAIAALLATHAGEQARAEQVAAAVAEVAARNDVPSLAGAALRCRGLVQDDPGVLRAAVDAYQQGPRPLELALAAEDAGAAFARRGKLDAAVPLLQQALVIHERLEAARDAARVEARLRDLGVRRGRRGARKRPQLGWESLTGTERRVVDLVVEGLSNPQIGERLYVSRRTVQTHLAHVFTKLGISSRAQLAAGRPGGEHGLPPADGAGRVKPPPTGGCLAPPPRGSLHHLPREGGRRCVPQRGAAWPWWLPPWSPPWSSGRSSGCSASP